MYISGDNMNVFTVLGKNETQSTFLIHMNIFFILFIFDLDDHLFHDVPFMMNAAIISSL